ncbi:MAG: MMPL family transporter [Alistipes sp.]|nr:MMPL family transporter [Candidatus Minthomonas equi]
MTGSFLLFAFLAVNVSFEENLLKLFPDTEQAKETRIAFGDLKVKDKIFVEVFSKEACDASAGTIAGAMDAFIDSLMAHDVEHNIDGCLWKFDQDMAMNALDFVMNNAVTFVSADLYPLIEDWMAQGAPEEVPQSVVDMLGEYTGDYALIDGFLFSPDSLAAVAYISPTFNSLDTKYAGKLLKQMEAEKNQICEAFPEIDIIFHGAAIEGAFNSRVIKSDLVLTLSISLLVICLVIGFCFRNKSTLLMLVIPIIYGSTFSLALIYIIKGGMSLMAIALGALILGTALSYCLHVLTHYKYVSEPEIVIREQSRPVCLGCLTTVGAFAGLLFTTSDLLRDFGLFASFSHLGTAFFALVYLPHFFNPGRNKRSRMAFRLVDSFNSIRFERCLPLVIIVAAGIIISFFYAPKVHFNPDLNNLNHLDRDVVRSKNYYSEHFDKGKFAMYYAGTGETLDDAILSARGVAAVLDSLEGTGLVSDRSHMYEILIPQIEQQLNIDRWKEYWTTREKPLPATLPSIAYSLIEADYEPVSLPESGALPEEFLSNIVEQSSDGGWMVFVMARMEKKDAHTVDDYVSEIPGSVVIDPYYYTEDMLKIIHSDFNIVLGVSSLFVLLVLMLSFGNFVISLIAFMPMFLSWFVVQGVMAFSGIEFNLFNIIVSSFIFGIGVDYSIFVMDGLLDNERGMGTRLLICHKAAISFSAFVLLTVIISMLFTTHQCIFSIGQVTVIGMASTLLITYVLEPLLFRLAMKTEYMKHHS